MQRIFRKVSLNLGVFLLVLSSIGALYAALPQETSGNPLTAEKWNDVVDGINNFGFDGAGNVGIGTESPEAELHVAGGGRIRFEEDGVRKYDWNIDTSGNFVLEDATGAIGRLWISPNGNIGAGISSPSEKLDVDGNIKSSGTICDGAGNCLNNVGSGGGSGGKFVDGTNTSDAVFTGGNVGIGTSDPQNNLSIGNILGHAGYAIGARSEQYGVIIETGSNSNITSGAALWARNINNGGTPIELLYAKNNGNIGIGTTNPSNNLTIEGNTGIKLSYLGYTTKEIGHNTHDMAFRIGAEDKMIIRNGNPGIGQVQSRASQFNFPSFSFIEDPDTGMYASGGNELFFTTGGANGRMMIDSLGNVGIANNSPKAKLDVNGQLVGGMGAMTTVGTADWNHITNARSGNGHTLLLGSHTNGPGGAAHYHPFNFEYGSKNGIGNLTQFAIPYNNSGVNNGIYLRTRFSGTFSNWSRIISENTTGNVGIGTTTPGSKLSVVGLPSGTSGAGAGLNGTSVGAVCIMSDGDMYIDTDGVCN